MCPGARSVKNMSYEGWWGLCREEGTYPVHCRQPRPSSCSCEDSIFLDFWLFNRRQKYEFLMWTLQIIQCYQCIQTIFQHLPEQTQHTWEAATSVVNVLFICFSLMFFFFYFSKLISSILKQIPLGNFEVKI